jgi:hypothetical protein
MSKLPMESRPLRLAPEVARVVERALAPLSGKKLEAAQAAILKVYQSGQQMTCEQWSAAYEQAIASVVGQREPAAA